MDIVNIWDKSLVRKRKFVESIFPILFINNASKCHIASELAEQCNIQLCLFDAKVI